MPEQYAYKCRDCNARFLSYISPEEGEIKCINCNKYNVRFLEVVEVKEPEHI